MKRDTRAEDHFLKRKRHTEIKHSVFQDVLKTSVYIANMSARGKGETFTYIDLFAGRGDFEDQAEGSPVLAFNIIEQHVLQEEGPGRNHFQKTCIVAIDKDTEAADHLRSLLVRRLEKSAGRERGIEVYTGNSNWELYDFEIRTLLSRSKWGFIFADPFSTELDIGKLKATLRAHAAFKDILILANPQTASRQSARGHANDIVRICKSLEIPPELVGRIAKSRELFAAALKEAFSSLKEFTIGVAMPVTVGGRLIKADYFYLVLATDSIVVADSFLTAYEGTVIKERGSKSQGMLFGRGQEILDAFERNNTSNLSLWDIMEDLWDNFLSWKNAIKGPGYEIPTIKNIIDKLNGLRARGKIVFKESEAFQYKVKRGNAEPGNLKYSEIRSGRDAKRIRVQLEK